MVIPKEVSCCFTVFSFLPEGSGCGASYTEPVDALGHDYTEIVTEPTCAAGGYTTHTCLRCGDSYTDHETEPLDHAWDAGEITIAPTCTKAGS